MRTFFRVCCVFLLLTSAGEAAVGPVVQGVDFYPSGARFVFQVKAEKNFDFTLPGAFLSDSVRLLTPDGVTSLRIESVPREQWVPPALVQMKAQIDMQDRELKLREARKDSLEETLAMIRPPLPKDFSGKDLILYIEDAQAMRIRIKAELVDLNLDIEKAAKELNALKEEYQRKLPHEAESVVQVSGTSAESKLLTFEARTQSAGWFVRYDMNLDSTTGKIDAEMSARVWQQTGIDIDGEFSFHTRQPSHAIYPPDVRPLVVALAPKAGEGRSSSFAPVPEMAMQAPVMNRMQMDSMRKAHPAVTSTLADVSVKGTGDLKGDGTPEDVALGKFTLKSSPVLVSIPEQNGEAWIIASMDAIPEPLLPGMAELAVDGAATGRSDIPEYGRGQTYLPFGMATRITAKKERLVSKTGSSWTGKGILEDGYTLEITNGMAAERVVTVRDRIPLPADEKIIIEVKKIDPAPSEQDKDSRLTWKITIKPGETRKINVEYTLRYPGDENLEYR